MTIEVSAPELLALAATLRAAADGADEFAARLSGTPSVGAPLQAAVEGLVDSQRAAGTALAGELRWLAATVIGVADSWQRLDGSLLTVRGPAVPR